MASSNGKAATRVFDILETFAAHARIGAQR
jgi:hypothetical protein